MSKSKPDSAIFVHDSPEEIKRKLKKAHCPEKETKNNPIIEYYKHIVFRGQQKNITIQRPSKYGGDITINTQTELEKLYTKGEIHPLDLKNKLADYLEKTLEPCRKKFNF